MKQLTFTIILLALSFHVRAQKPTYGLTLQAAHGIIGRLRLLLIIKTGKCMMKRKFDMIGVALLIIIGMTFMHSCSPYDDGPSISLRSRKSRMAFERPLTYYESAGIDSTVEVNRMFLDSLAGFDGVFRFSFDPTSYEYQLIYWGDPNGTIGSYIPNDDYTLIWLNMPPLYHWRFNWTVTRLSHRDLWLESSDGKKLRFEE